MSTHGKNDKKFVRGRSAYRLNQKVQKFEDRRTKRNRARDARRQRAIQDQLDSE